MTITNEKLIEISETIRDHLIKQNEQSMSDHFGCAYRGPNGSMCAVGCLIKDEHYTDKIEESGVYDKGVRDVVGESLGVDIPIGSPLYVILDEWQQYHDEDYGFFAVDPTEPTSPTSEHVRIMKTLELV